MVIKAEELIKVDSLWDAITKYKYPIWKVREKCEEYLMQYFYQELVDKFNEDKPEDEKYDGSQPNDKFRQFAHDYLDSLFR